MLFNSTVFIFLFLPATLGLYFLAGRLGRVPAIATLAAASFFFYGWWSPPYVALLAASTLFNFLVARGIGRSEGRARRALLVTGIAGDLLVLGYYKYWNFLVGSAAAALGLAWQTEPIVLPIGISFFTFTQIAFLVDTWRGETRGYGAAEYALFVSFFPHLLAGPLLHHKEMMPQFADPANVRPRAENFSVGLTIFIIGLAKKTLIADSVAPFANTLFHAAGAGAEPGLVEAWGGALAYTFQLYFDFSGYSDMALGAARCFGIVMPLNFYSPYRATSIIEFWRRWHMTLSRFLRDYLYIPLGGNRHGPARRHVNLMLTMLLGGLWHGAAWTFVAWGALHGAYLVLNHAWRGLAVRLGVAGRGGVAGEWAGRLVTFIAVVFGWVLFRADSFAAAQRVIAGMVGANGIAPRPLAEMLAGAPWGALYAGRGQTLWLVFLLLVVFLAPSTQDFMTRVHPALAPKALIEARWPRLAWAAEPGWAIAFVLLLVGALSQLSGVSEFLYYQF